MVPCKGTAIVKENKILIHKAHNHTPDEAIYNRLHARHKVRESVTSSSQPTKQAFDDAMRDEPGGELYQDESDDEIQLQPQVRIPTCVVCMDNPPNVVLVPCGHQNLCSPCANQWKDENGTCPQR